jgi:hypothetical protein
MVAAVGSLATQRAGRETMGHRLRMRLQMDKRQLYPGDKRELYPGLDCTNPAAGKAMRPEHVPVPPASAELERSSTPNGVADRARPNGGDDPATFTSHQILLPPLSSPDEGKGSDAGSPSGSACADDPPLRAGCRARLIGLGQMPELNGEEVLVLRLHRPSARWVVQRVCSSAEAPDWPSESPGYMRVSANKLVPARVSVHERLAYDDAGRGKKPCLLARILRMCAWRDMARVACVDKECRLKATTALSEWCVRQYARSLPRAPASVELAAPIAGDILPLLHRKLEQLAEKVKPCGGDVRACLVAGPVLHIGQFMGGGDLSCAYRVLQMQLSHVLGRAPRSWPGAHETFLDVPDVRCDARTSRAVPSVARLQRTVEAAWHEGYDKVGAEQLEFKTLKPGASPKKDAAAEPAGSVRGRTATGGGRSASPTRRPAASEEREVLDNHGVPVHQPGLKMLGASDMWAVIRWSGVGTQLHDFIDGEEGESTASELLFEWVWKHLYNNPQHASMANGPLADAASPVCCSRAPPIYLQWAGHAVCIVGAVRRRLHKQAAPERHLLIFNPESNTQELHAAMCRREEEFAVPFPPWWRMVAWPAIRTRRGPRILLAEAIEQSAGNPGTSEKGPGGENGPYQTMCLTRGWVVSEEERERVRSPEDACTQHVGDRAPVVLAEMAAANAQGHDTRREEEEASAPA